MARDKRLAPNVDNSNPSLYPNGRIQDNTGSGNGTPVNNFVYSDLHEMKDKLFRLSYDLLCSEQMLLCASTYDHRNTQPVHHTLYRTSSYTT